LEYNAKIQIKIDSGYHLPGETSNTLVLPQLAKKFDIKKFDIKKYPVILQKKLDGIRSLLTNDTLYSRQGKPLLPELFTKFHIPLDDGIHLDGELILPFPYTFQETISAIKKYNENTDKLEYHVYDLYDSNNPNLSFVERYQKLCDIVDNQNNKSIKLVDNIWCTNSKNLIYYHELFVENGYEGTMVRISDAPYTPGHRSSALMKYKDFVDSEFKILAVKGGEGLYHDCGVFECAAGNSTFNVMLADTLAAKRYVLANPQQYIGKFLKVKYQNLTDGGVPRFPVGIGVRDEVEG
jgi:DNA ligase-1